MSDGQGVLRADARGGQLEDGLAAARAEEAEGWGSQGTVEECGR